MIWEEMVAKIAIIPIKGTIVSEKSRLPSMKTTSSLDVVPLLAEIKKNKAIKALVLEINSPGGTPFSCEEITQAIKAVNKPVVAWVREMAASGGYWIATAADSIVAGSLSTVGSVGVISIRPNVSELLDKIGIDIDTVASGVHKMLGLPFKPLSPEEKQEERQRREEEISIIQQSFIRQIQQKRQLKEEVIKEISSGKTYLGQEAKDLGLVDELGGKEKAFEIAAKKANITKFKVVDFTKKLERPRRGLLSRLFVPW
jgi:protease-4